MPISNVHEYTVSDLSGRLKRVVEDQFGNVRVRGELSGVKRAASGHVYLALKDEHAVIDGVCWRGTASKLGFIPEDGLEVICTGKLTTYPARSKYQLVIEQMEPAGAGALMALLEERKKKLAGEGLFEADRKKPIPFLPETIGVVTSPTGAVIRDILHRLEDRFPRHVLVWPVLVQGQGAAEQIAAAIEGFNALDGRGDIPRPDVLIVARGGGSIEDLWCFNEEAVVRAVAGSAIPVISAVGHETDTTLVDFASDRRAPTPTGAAEMAVPVRMDLVAAIDDLSRRLMRFGQRTVAERIEQLRVLARLLPKPEDIWGTASQRLDEISDKLPWSLKHLVILQSERLTQISGGLNIGRLKDRAGYEHTRLTAASARLERAYKTQLEHRDQRLENSLRMLTSLSYERVLERGYVLVTSDTGKPVTSARSVTVDDVVNLAFYDGEHKAAIVSNKAGVAAGKHGQTVQSKKGSRSPKASKSQKKSPDTDKQGQLF